MRRTAAQDLADAQRELQALRRKAAAAQATLDALLLKAAQAEEGLAEGFLRLARQKQGELSLLQQGITQIPAGERQDGRRAAEVSELAQTLTPQYVTLSAPQKRQISQSVFLNLRLDHVSLCGDCRLPFSILVENGTCPLNSG